MVSNDKEKYVNLIGTSPLFTLDKETEYVAYKREAVKMIEYLYQYVLAINESKYIDFGYEIVVTARRCISNYDSTKGDFINYFNSVWAKEYRKAIGKRQAEDVCGGMHITDNDQRLIKKYLRYYHLHNVNVLDENKLALIAIAMNISVHKLKEILMTVKNTSVLKEIPQMEDGNLTSIFDIVKSHNDVDEGLNFLYVLDQIERVFLALQSRQKSLLSDLITNKIIDELMSNQEWLEYAKKLTFFSNRIYEYYLEGRNTTAKDIATAYEISEQSASRSLRVFLEHLKKAIISSKVN